MSGLEPAVSFSGTIDENDCRAGGISWVRRDYKWRQNKEDRGIIERKDSYLKVEDLQILIGSKLFCIATDRIIIEGCKMGYMMRKEPRSNRPQDSGWIFFEGTEDEDYMNDSSHLGVYIS